MQVKQWDDLARRLEINMNQHTRTLKRRPPNPNKQEARKVSAESYITKANTTSLTTPKPSKADCQAAEMAKLQAKFEAQAAAIHREGAE